MKIEMFITRTKLIIKLDKLTIHQGACIIIYIRPVSVPYLTQNQPLTKVAECGGGPSSARVAVLDPGHSQQLLGHGSTDNSGTPGGRDQTH